MNEEIRNILLGVKDGDKVIKYIETLEEHLEHHHHHNDDCDCGCHDDEEEEWEEIKTPYKNQLTVEDWEKLLKNPRIFTVDSLKVMKRMKHIAAPTSSMELADTFGFGCLFYSLECNRLETRLLPYVNADNLEENQRWAILFNCWRSKKEYNTEIFALRPELYEALGNTDLSNIPLKENEI